MNILMLTNTYTPHVGGVARSVRAFAEEYRRLGHRVLIVAPQFEGAPRDERDVVRVPAIQKFNGSDFSVRLPIPGLLSTAVADFEPELVHSHHPFLLGDTALRIAVSRDLPLVFTHHTMYERYTHYVPGDSPAMARFVTNLATGYANLCDQVFAPSQSVAAVLKERGVTTPIEVVPTGVDVAAFARGDGRSFRHRLGIPAEAFVVGHVGRLAPEKNLGFLAEAVAAMLRRQKDAHFLIVGAGPSQEEIERLFDRLRVGSRLHLAGTHSGPSLADAYHAMDVFAFASHTETQGMVLTEAMAAGVPVVALDAPGAREIVVDGKNGRLLSSQSVRRFVVAMEWVRVGGLERRRALSESARRTAESFSMERTAGKALSVYRSALAGSARVKHTEDSAWESALRWIEGEWELLSNVARAASTAWTPPWRVPGLRALGRTWQRVRRWTNRQEWGIRLLRLGTSEGTSTETGLVMLQIDGLSQTQFERALARGRLPILRRLMASEGYQLHTMYSGLPSSTPAVQGELFYGAKTAVPTFSFRDEHAGGIVRMYEAEAAARVQSRLGSHARGLLEGGSAYSNIFTGGAAEAHFCCSAMGLGDVLRRANPLGILALLFWHVLTLIRAGGLIVIEFLLALVDFVRGVIGRGELKAELKFIYSRVMICIWLREMITLGTTIDAVRGLPVIHANFLGYDEHAHRRNPRSAFAHWTLRGIDHCIGRIWRAARSSRRRDYEVWIYSDHGQEHTMPFLSATGRSVHEAVAAVFQAAGAEPAIAARSASRGVAGQRAQWLGGRMKPELLAHAGQVVTEPGHVVVAAMGPVGHVYCPEPLTAARRAELARRMAAEAGIPVVVTSGDEGQLLAFTAEGCYPLPERTEAIVGPDHPFLKDVRRDLVAVCRHPDSGDFVIFGYRRHGLPLSFPIEHGAHGGYGPEETRGFVLLPQGVSLPPTECDYLRPLDLRAAALHLLGRGRMTTARRSRTERTHEDTFRVMTYNIRNCLGTDGRLSPARIARVIAQHDPDVVALQEVDVRRRRSGEVDQVHAIANELAMEFHFYPAIEEVGELYGDAVLSRCPMRLVRAGLLPGLPGVEMEPRGALWVELDMQGRKLQLLNTHLGLLPRERLRQVEALMGPEWLEHPDWRDPVIVCGDLNAMPRSRAYRRLADRLHDVQLCLDDHRPRRTFLSRYPLGRIDHIFIGAGIEVTAVQVPRTELVRKASDHLPLVAEVRFV